MKYLIVVLFLLPPAWAIQSGDYGALKIEGLTAYQCNWGLMNPGTLKTVKHGDCVMVIKTTATSSYSQETGVCTVDVQVMATNGLCGDEDFDDVFRGNN